MQVVNVDLKLYNKGIPKQNICLRYFPKLLKKSLVFRARLVAVFFSLRLKTMTMCFKLNIFHDNLAGYVCETFFSSEILWVATRIGIYHIQFLWNNLISKILKKQSLLESRFKKIELQSTTQNSFKHHHICSQEGILKLLHRKLLKISRKCM